MGTSHRQAPVKAVVGRVRTGLRELFSLPDGYEVALGNGGTTAFWDAAACGLVRRRALHLVLRRVLQQVRLRHRGRAVPRRPDRRAGRARRRAGARGRPGRRRRRLGPQRDLDRRDGRRHAAPRARRRARPDRRDLGRGRPARRRRAGRRLLLRPAEVLRLRRRPLARAAEPRRARRGSRSWRAPTAGSPSSCRWPRRWTTPARTRPTTRPRSRRSCCWPTRSSGCSSGAVWTGACAARARRPARSTAGPSAVRCATPFVADPAKRSLVVGTIDFADDVDAAALAATLRANGIVDVEPYRKLGRNQLRVGLFPAVEPADVEALTACIDYVLERRS